MKYLVLAVMLATITACGSGRDATVRCPDDEDQQLSRAEWKACFGRQDKDGKGGK